VISGSLESATEVGILTKGIYCGNTQKITLGQHHWGSAGWVVFADSISPTPAAKRWSPCTWGSGKGSEAQSLASRLRALVCQQQATRTVWMGHSPPALAAAG
jgi:hypothetical protein